MLHNDNPLSFEEKGILAMFRELGVPAGESVPNDIIGARLARRGYLGGPDPSKWESAYISLEVRGLIEPGENPFSAICWRLTPHGHAFAHSVRMVEPDC